MATGSLIYFPKQATPRKSKPTDKKPKPKAPVLDWILGGFQFPGKPKPPDPEPQKRDEGGAR